MAEVTPTRAVRHRGRLFPEIQWSNEKKAQRRDEAEVLYQRCQVIFERLQPELIKTHYNWYMAIEPDSERYIIERDEMAMYQKIRQTFPNTKNFLFRINQTGVSGTI